MVLPSCHTHSMWLKERKKKPAVSCMNNRKNCINICINLCWEYNIIFSYHCHSIKALLCVSKESQALIECIGWNGHFVPVFASSLASLDIDILNPFFLLCLFCPPLHFQEWQSTVQNPQKGWVMKTYKVSCLRKMVWFILLTASCSPSIIHWIECDRNSDRWYTDTWDIASCPYLSL